MYYCEGLRMELNPPHATWLEINLGAVERNVRNVMAATGTAFMSVLKANAYGHGAVEVGRAALKGGAAWLAVARVDEAVALRSAGIDAPVLVLGMIPYAQVDLAIRHDITLPLPNFEAIDVYSGRAKALGKSLNVHLKVDTGMGRLGVLQDEVLPLAKRALQAGGVQIDGLYSHFAMADRQHDPLMDVQIRCFKQALQSLEEAGIRPRWAHLCNTGGSLAFPEARFDLVRGGSSTVGLNPFEYRDLPEALEPALTAWKARLVSCKTLPPGWGVGYGSTYVTKGGELIGVVSAGFGDGIRRVPGNEVIIDGTRVPVVGAVCMDAVMVKLPKPYPLDSQVLLLGSQGDQTITVDDIAGRYNTVHVDFLMGLTPRVPRLYYWD
jgi:alanine racemase